MSYITWGFFLYPLLFSNLADNSVKKALAKTANIMTTYASSEVFINLTNAYAKAKPIKAYFAYSIDLFFMNCLPIKDNSTKIIESDMNIVNNIVKIIIYIFYKFS